MDESKRESRVAIEGTLEKLSDHFRIWRNRYFQLIGTKLLVFYKITDHLPQYTLDLTQAKIADDGETSGDLFVFCVTMSKEAAQRVGSAEEIFLGHRSRDVFRQWVRSLQKAVNDVGHAEKVYQKLRLSGVKVTSGQFSEEEQTAMYNVRVKTSDGEKFIVVKRYSAFEDLHYLLQLVVRSDKKVKLPMLPEKKSKLFYLHSQPSFIGERRTLLDSYLRRLFAIDAVRTSREFIDFCTSDRHVAASLAASAIESDDESEELPEDFEITHIEVPGTRVMSDHVLFRFEVSNIRLRSSFSTWSVLKRYAQIVELDQRLRVARQKLLLPSPNSTHSSPPQPAERKNSQSSVSSLFSRLSSSSLIPPELHLPLLPAKQPKMIIDHADPHFVEERRVLIEAYFQKLLRIRWVAHNNEFLDFLGVR